MTVDKYVLLDDVVKVCDLIAAECRNRDDGESIKGAIWGGSAAGAETVKRAVLLLDARTVDDND